MELRGHSLANLLKRSAARYPQRMAIVCGEVRWTYAQFVQLCDRLAAGLASIGVMKGDRIGILARNSHAFAAMRFALARLGAVLVPVNFMLNSNEAAYILGHSGARLLATDSGLADVARSAAQTAGILQLLWMPSEESTDPEHGMLNFNVLAESKSMPPAPEPVINLSR